MKKLAAVRTGRRELNKEDKLRRIREAARKLFVANGYDEASTRQIAVKAGVALGTLFLYAANKRDLLFLVVNDDLEKVADRAVAAVRSDASLIENLIAVFRPLYEFFGKEPRLSRLTLREMMFYEFRSSGETIPKDAPEDDRFVLRDCSDCRVKKRDQVRRSISQGWRSLICHLSNRDQEMADGTPIECRSRPSKPQRGTGDRYQWPLYVRQVVSM